MRKKTHIALSAYLVKELRIEELDLHWKALYFGSILPDLNPKMVKMPHEYDTSWDKVSNLILQIESEAKADDCDPKNVWLHVGVVLHYLADYFTYPHNTCYGGTLKGHCLFESELKYVFRAYLLTSEASDAFRRQQICAGQIHTTQQLLAHIERMHAAYMLEPVHTVMSDCRWITDMCFCAGIVMARMVCPETQSAGWVRSCVA